MPVLDRGNASIYYEDTGGDGYPVLLFAPGAMDAALDVWHRLPGPLDPYVGLGPHFRLIGFDERLAGRSTAKIDASYGWHTFAEDAVALIRHLGLTSFAMEGCCVGVPHSLKALELLGPDAPKVSALVALNPAGRDAPNRGRFMAMFYKWVEGLPAEQLNGPPLMDPVFASFSENMYGGDFVFSVTREFTRTLQLPMLVIPGNDLAHPEALGRELASVAPNTELDTNWPANPDACAESILHFLRKHTAGK